MLFMLSVSCVSNRKWFSVVCVDIVFFLVPFTPNKLCVDFLRNRNKLITPRGHQRGKYRLYQFSWRYELDFSLVRNIASFYISLREFLKLSASLFLTKAQ